MRAWRGSAPLLCLKTPDEFSLPRRADWRLPTIEEFNQIYSSSDENTESLRSQMSMSRSYVWSSTEGEQGLGSAWGFSFLNGSRMSAPVHFSLRAVCVRDPSE